MNKEIICSFDVGILNLAYCIFEYNKKLDIQKWDIINFSERKNYICCGLKKSGDKCGKKATFRGVSYNNIEYTYCGTHKSSYKPFDFGIHYYLSDIENSNKQIRCDYLLPKKNTKCNAIARKTNKKENYCNNHSKIIIKKMIKSTELHKIKKKKCTSSDMQLLAKNMYAELDKIKEFGNVTTVYIENQPSFKNPSMKTISALLFGYFIMKGTKVVKFISPSNKLKITPEYQEKLFNSISNDHRIYSIINKYTKKYESKEDVKNILKNIIYQEKKKDKIFKDTDKDYNINKELAIEYTKLLLLENRDKKNITHLLSYKKKDDLCDALLQGYFKVLN